MTDKPASTQPAAPAVAGHFDGTFAEHVRRAGVLINEEQAKPLPNNALISFMCDAIRLAREAIVSMSEHRLLNPDGSRFEASGSELSGEAASTDRMEEAPASAREVALKCELSFCNEPRMTPDARFCARHSGSPYPMEEARKLVKGVRFGEANEEELAERIEAYAQAREAAAAAAQRERSAVIAENYGAINGTMVGHEIGIAIRSNTNEWIP